MASVGASARPSGNVPGLVDLTGLTEIRIHGVGGSTPAALLDDPAPQQVSGDRIAGFYRTRDRGGRHVEAYSWGGLTSRSASRALWLLLLPFMLSNLSGWMAHPAPSTPDKAGCAGSPAAPGTPPSPGVAALGDPRPTRKLPDTPPTGWAFFWIARLVALVVTTEVLAMICLGALDVVAYQCGGQPSCASAQWWTWPLTWASLDAHPSRRLVVGAAFPLAVIGMFALLSYTSRRRYEKVEPPTAADAIPVPLPDRTAATLADGLLDRGFWAGMQAHTRLSRLHISAALVVVALVVTHCASTTSRVAVPSGPVGTWLSGTAWVLGVLTASAIVVHLRYDWPHRAVSLAVLGGATITTLLALVFAFVQPSSEAGIGHLPGMRWAFNVAWGLTLIPLLLLLGWCVITGNRRRGKPSTTFRWGAPFVVNGIGMIVSNLVLLGIIILTGQTLSSATVQWEGLELQEPAADVQIYLYPAMRIAINLLTIGLLLMVLLTLIVGLYAFLRAARATRLAALREVLDKEYARKLSQPPGPRPRDQRAWVADALGTSDDQRQVSMKWVRSIARWRLIGRSTTKISYVLTATVAVGIVLTIVVNLVWVLTGWLPPVNTGIGVAIAILLPPLLLTLVWRSWRQVDKRKVVGVLWDVGTYFPRSFHPFAPPSYSERAVPELLRRIWYLHDHGGRVLLAAHSQGSMLAAAALAQRSPRYSDHQEPQVHLATYGSPLRTLYHWAFPAYFPDTLLESLASAGFEIGTVPWRNFYYQTDYIGGAVLPSAALGPKIDTVLNDPPTHEYVYGQPPPAVGSHTGYWRDPYLWNEIDSMAAIQLNDPPPPIAEAD